MRTGTSRRTVTVDAHTMSLLAEWRVRRTADLAGAGVENSHALVSTRPCGPPLHPHAVSQAFERAQRRVAVSPIRFHDLRHTHATLLLRDRVPIDVMSERLGHSNPAFTMMTCQHVLPGMHEDAANTFGHVLAGHSPERIDAAIAAEPAGVGSGSVAAENAARLPTARKPCQHSSSLVARGVEPATFGF